MKEKWIKKLIDLLNESEDWFVSKFVSYDDINWVFRLNSWQSFHYTLILSKEYCFIKRLVENNKIDFTKLEDNSDWYSIELWDDCCEVLALLSIQDNPVEFLISILK